MKNLPIHAAGALLLVLVAGCSACGTAEQLASSPSGGSPEKTLPGEHAPGSFAVRAHRLADALCRAFVRNDAGAFRALLPERIRGEFQETAFEQARRKLVSAMGDAVGWEYAATLRHPLLNVQLWKIAFCKTASDGAEKITQEALFQVMIGEVDGRAEVVSFGFL